MPDYFGPDLDPYETGAAPDPVECQECGGSGYYARATWIDPEELCEACEGSGVIDCNCPGRCGLHEDTAYVGVSSHPTPDPWANQPAEPPF